MYKDLNLSMCIDLMVSCHVTDDLYDDLTLERSVAY